ncbi:hypothetical protein K0651_06465 [Ornithinimicrobium sp. Arc0846-15]|nr:hypothetical protein [Ornithinimicrobium laminariae]
MKRHTITSVVAAVLVAAATSGCLRPEAVVTPAPGRPTVGEPAPGLGTEPAAETSAPALEEELVDAEVTLAEADGFFSNANAALESGDDAQWGELLFVEGDEWHQQDAWFNGVQDVPMSERRFDLMSSSAGANGDWRVEFVHQIDGADRVPVIESYRFTLGKTSAGDVGITGVDGFGRAYPQLWDVGAIEVVVADSTVVLHQADADISDQLLAEIDKASALTLKQWPVPEVDTMVVGLAPTEQMTVLFGGDDVEAAGFMSPIQTAERADVGVGRVVLDLPYSVNELRYYDQVDAGLPLMRHEGLHLALELQTGYLRGPEWAIEGLPTWWEGVDDEAVATDLFDYSAYSSRISGLEPAWPPAEDSEFFNGDDEAIDRHYTDSALVFAYIAETYGEQAAIALGSELNDASGSADEATETAVQEHLGISAAEFRVDWEAWAEELSK